MPAIKKLVARKAAKTAAKHTAHGTAAKLRRSPVRALTLLGLGGAIGALAGWMAARAMDDSASAGGGTVPA
jgi:hypothetical protein